MPNENIVAGQNFAIAQVLMAVISGVSTTLYDSEGEPGKLFTAVVEKCFPWHMEPKGGVPPKAAAAIIYDVFRNPLTHNAGVYFERYGNKRRLVQKKYIVKVGRLLNKDKTAGHAEDWIEKLEASRSRPRFGPTLKVAPHKKVLLVESLYWGVRHMIEQLTADQSRMQKAAQLLKPYT